MVEGSNPVAVTFRYGACFEQENRHKNRQSETMCFNLCFCNFRRKIWFSKICNILFSIAAILLLASNHLFEVSTTVNLFSNFCHRFNLIPNIQYYQYYLTILLLNTLIPLSSAFLPTEDKLKQSTRFIGSFRIPLNMEAGYFCKNCQRLSPVTYFRKIFHLTRLCSECTSGVISRNILISRSDIRTKNVTCF